MSNVTNTRNKVTTECWNSSMLKLYTIMSLLLESDPCTLYIWLLLRKDVVSPLLIKRLHLLLYNVDVDLVPVPVVYWVLIRRHSRAVVVGVVSFTGVAEFFNCATLHLRCISKLRWPLYDISIGYALLLVGALKWFGQTISVEVTSCLYVEVMVELNHTKPVGLIALSYQDVDRRHPRLLAIRGQSPQLV